MPLEPQTTVGNRRKMLVAAIRQKFNNDVLRNLVSNKESPFQLTSIPQF